MACDVSICTATPFYECCETAETSCGRTICMIDRAAAHPVISRYAQFFALFCGASRAGGAVQRKRLSARYCPPDEAVSTRMLGDCQTASLRANADWLTHCRSAARYFGPRVEAGKRRRRSSPSRARSCCPTGRTRIQLCLRRRRAAGHAHAGTTAARYACGAASAVDQQRRSDRCRAGSWSAS